MNDDVRNDDLEFAEDIDEELNDTVQDEDIADDAHDDAQEDSKDSDNDILDSLLKERGISDKSKIKFENAEGVVEDVDWNDLSDSDKLNVLNSSSEDPDTDLDDSEILLINAIRSSGMNPAEYLNYVSNYAVSNYAQNTLVPQFEIDLYDDDELFLMDLLSRTLDITEDEALSALQLAKSNESLYQKQMTALRSEYQQAEQENIMQAAAEEEYYEQLQYAEFTNLIVDKINDLKEIQGFELNMEDNDMQLLYDFITGSDAAGNNYFAKAMADPQTLVRTAWLALNGDQMISDITNYFLKEIANVRKESYKKGVEDTKNKMNRNNVVYKSKSRVNKDFDDLDDF